MKATPSPVVFRQKMLRNCLSAIRSKRSGVIDKFRNGSIEARSAMVGTLLGEVYKASCKENNNSHIEDKSAFESRYCMGRGGKPFVDYEDELIEYIGSEEHQNLMNEIAEAIDLELEQESNQCLWRENILAEQAQQMAEEILENEIEDEFARIELYEEDEDNVVICPLCRNAQMSVCGETGRISCQCGISISLYSDTMDQNVTMEKGNSNTSVVEDTSSIFKGPATGHDRSRFGSTLPNTESTMLTGAEFKQRLADVYDKHLFLSSTWMQKQQQRMTHEDSFFASTAIGDISPNYTPTIGGTSSSGSGIVENDDNHVRMDYIASHQNMSVATSATQTGYACIAGTGDSNSNSSSSSRCELEFHMQSDHLYAFCGECCFTERVI